MNEPTYDIEDHRSVIAAWAGARAAQRGLAGGHTAVLVAALHASGVIDAVRNRNRSRYEWTPRSFDGAHMWWCELALDHLHSEGVAMATFGRVAKLIAVYLETAVILAGDHDTDLGRVAHPPIDEILLRALAASDRFSRAHRRLWRATRWTQLDAEAYLAVIDSFRDEGLHEPAFWTIERVWKPTGQQSPRSACPSCGSSNVVPIIFGMPTMLLAESARRGECTLRGCLVTGRDPGWCCMVCDTEFGSAPKW